MSEISEIVDVWIKDIEDINRPIERLRERKADLLGGIPQGRSEGTTQALYKSGRGWRTSISIKLLRDRVSKSVIESCSFRMASAGSVRIVAKRKPKKRKDP